jgi:hypothetical protein
MYPCRFVHEYAVFVPELLSGHVIWLSHARQILQAVRDAEAKMLRLH